MQIVINGRFLTQAMTGVQRYAHEVTRALDVLLDQRPDLDVEMLCPRLENKPTGYRNIRIREVGTRTGHGWEQIDLPKATAGRLLFCPGNTAPASSLLRGKPVIVCVHDLSYLYFPTAYSRAFRLVYGFLTPLILKRARAVITVSESERAAITARYPYVKDRIVAIQNGGLAAPVPTTAVDPADTPEPGYVLYVGSLSKRKNFPNMLKVATMIAKRRDARFVFVGGTAAGLEGSEQATAADLSDQIIFAGQVNDTARLVSLYRNAAVFMFPSFYEASPLPPIEAMACGAPVVSGAIPSLQERCGDAALYCDPSDPNDIAKQVEALLDDPKLRDTMIERGKARAARFTWANCAARTLEVLER
ncbi:glycosyltransferase family 1 protein [soil metagenome]